MSNKLTKSNKLTNKQLSCSIGITAYNEEKNITNVLESLSKQKLNKVKITEILVISSGSTDKTVKLAKEFSRINNKVKVISEKERNGKASAVNIFIELAKEDILVLESADTIPLENTIENLVYPFFDNDVGISGSHPMPINSTDSIAGFAVNCLWELHHYISLSTPKMGETIAFRKSFKKIPIFSAVDEANIEALIIGQGYRAVYVPEAIVQNKGAENIREFILQRRRIYFGHLSTKSNYRYTVSTIGSKKIFFILIKNFIKKLIDGKISNLPKELFFTFSTIMLEAYSRFLGYKDFRYSKKTYHIWDISETTKDLNSKKSTRLYKK